MGRTIDKHKILWYKDPVIDFCTHSLKLRGQVVSTLLVGLGLTLCTWLGLYVMV